jgi:hypothetical protein
LTTETASRRNLAEGRTLARGDDEADQGAVGDGTCHKILFTSRPVRRHAPVQGRSTDDTHRHRYTLGLLEKPDLVAGHTAAAYTTVATILHSWLHSVEEMAQEYVAQGRLARLQGPILETTGDGDPPNSGLQMMALRFAARRV